jgi:hypothetical protein
MHSKKPMFNTRTRERGLLTAAHRAVFVSDRANAIK